METKKKEFHNRDLQPRMRGTSKKSRNKFDLSYCFEKSSQFMDKVTCVSRMGPGTSKDGSNLGSKHGRVGSLLACCGSKQKNKVLFHCLEIDPWSYTQGDSYDFVHENVGNPALNTRPTILKHFFVNFYYFRDGLVKNLISNIYCQNIRS
jgi:hypothetical protein